MRNLWMDIRLWYYKLENKLFPYKYLIRINGKTFDKVYIFPEALKRIRAKHNVKKAEILLINGLVHFTVK